MSKSKKRLVVIDGKSVFYRGYYAMPYLATKDGQSTGGVYGFAVMALEILKKMDPDYVCVAWDKPKTNIGRRREIYPEYKANRKPAPPDFYEQIPILHQMLEAFNWPFYEVDDHEADDIMATFAEQASQKGYESILITSDHDMLQTIDDDTVVAIMKKGLTNVDYLNPERFEKKYEMTPLQFIDYKSLRGDPSDNLPGVAGVGEKTATTLIKKYGSLDGVYENIHEISGSLQGKLIKDKDNAYMTQKLVILERHVPVTLDWEAADITNTEGNKVAKILSDLEFKSLLNQLPDDMKQSADDLKQANTFVSKTKAVSIASVADMAKMGKAPEHVVLHSFTAGAVNTDLKVLLVSPSPEQVFVFNFDKLPLDDEVVAQLTEYLGAAKLTAHDTKAVIKSLIQAGVGELKVEHDVKMASFLVNSLIRDLTLSGLAQHELGYEGDSVDDLSPEDLILKAELVAGILWALHEKQAKDLASLADIQKLATDVEWPLVNVLARMEIAGLGIDTKFLRDMSSRLADQLEEVEQEIYGHADQEFNISSPSQLADVLFETMGLPSTGIKKGKTGFSTAASELDKLRGKHEIIDCITRYRELAKLKNTYVDPLPEMVDEESRLHTTFSTWVAPTGRLSSHDPNLQNIPIRSEVGREIRKGIVARPGHVFISADYSQFELRLAAVLAGDAELIESFNDGLDIHTRTAAQVYGLAIEDVTKDQRRDAKVINFGILYGMSPHGLSVATGMNLADAKAFIDRYFDLRKPILEYIEKTRDEAKEQGYVETMFGRRRPTLDVLASNYVIREGAYRAAINHPIQGTEADLMKMAMIDIDTKLDDDCIQLLQIHDSILVEAPEAKADAVAQMMVDTMEGVFKLDVKLDVDVAIGSTWGDL